MYAKGLIVGKADINMSNWIHIVVLLVQSFSNAEYFISSNTVDTEHARTICHLATPVIMYSKDGNTVDLNITEFPAHGKLWVGYALELKTFLYIGCFDPGGWQVNETIDKNPGTCFSFCKSQFIGMQENDCYCIHSQPMTNGTGECTSTCDKPAGTPCGTKSKGVSVYKNISDNGSNDSDPGDRYCQTVKRSSTNANFIWNYVWEDCSSKTKFGIICKNESSQNFYVQNDTQQWHESVKACYIKGLQPTESIHGISEVITDTNKRWIGNIRSWVIKRTEGISHVNNAEVQQGYIEKGKGQVVKLQFQSSAKNHGQLHALCTRETATTPQTITISTAGDIANNSTLSQATEGDTSSLVAVFVLIPLLIVITLAVILLLLWRKRRNTVEKKEDPTLSQENDHSNPISRNTLSDESYQDGDVRHDYFTLEPVNEYAEIKDVVVTAATDNEYDTTANLPKKANDTSNDTDNVYNKLEDLTDDTYNHRNTAAASVENTYDKATYDEKETTYNTADALPGSGIANDKVTDSEYNTLGSSGGT